MKNVNGTMQTWCGTGQVEAESGKRRREEMERKAPRRRTGRDPYYM